MNQKQGRITALLSIALLSPLTGCTDAEMRALLGEPSSDQQPPDQVIHSSDTSLPGDPIDRATFERIYNLGGGVDPDGNFHTPIYSDDLWNQRVESGSVIHPTKWDPDNLQIQYGVEGGNVTRMDYLYRGDEQQP